MAPHRRAAPRRAPRVVRRAKALKLGPAAVDDAPVSPRCPACGARTPSGASWCSLCHAALRPPEPAGPPVPAWAPPGAQLGGAASSGVPGGSPTAVLASVPGRRGRRRAEFAEESAAADGAPEGAAEWVPANPDGAPPAGLDDDALDELTRRLAEESDSGHDPLLLLRSRSRAARAATGAVVGLVGTLGGIVVLLSLMALFGRLL